MKLVLCNDDGIHAEGIKTLSRYLRQDYDVTIVAPDHDASGISSALTLGRPLKLLELEKDQYVVDGTPADCGHLAVNHPDLPQFSRLISGINSHENLGDDVIYSGTVGAAMEGRFLNLPSIAISLVNDGLNHYNTAARVMGALIKSNIGQGMPTGTVLNVNVPDKPYEALKGMRWCRLGKRHLGEPPVRTQCPRGRDRYWIGAAGKPRDYESDTDFAAVEAGYVSITPISADMTCYNLLKSLEDYEDLG